MEKIYCIIFHVRSKTLTTQVHKQSPKDAGKYRKIISCFYYLQQMWQ